VNYNKHGGNWTWDKLYAGDQSTSDGSGVYLFEITSMWAPGNVEASIVAGLDHVASGMVVGPVPEPATLALLTSADCS